MKEQSMILREIDLSKNKQKLYRNDSCKHDDIKLDKKYIALIYNNYYIGDFSLQWYGWSFRDWGTSGIQLDSGGFERLWEIVKFPE